MVATSPDLGDGAGVWRVDELDARLGADVHVVVALRDGPDAVGLWRLDVAEDGAVLVVGRDGPVNQQRQQQEEERRQDAQQRGPPVAPRHQRTARCKHGTEALVCSRQGDTCFSQALQDFARHASGIVCVARHRAGHPRKQTWIPQSQKCCEPNAAASQPPRCANEAQAAAPACLPLARTTNLYPRPHTRCRKQAAVLPTAHGSSLLDEERRELLGEAARRVHGAVDPSVSPAWTLEELTAVSE